MSTVTPETRPSAPGKLGVLQEFLNSGHLGGRAEITPDLVVAIRARHAAGASNAAIAGDLGVGQKFVAAVARGAQFADDLSDPDAATRWLAARNLLLAGTQLDAGDVVLLRELRELLRQLAAANNGASLEPGTLTDLGRIATAHPVAVEFRSHSDGALRPLVTGPGFGVGAILAMVYEAMRDGSFQRLKRCPGDGCPHTFYDASRNRTGTWCAMSVCGNRTKVRNYQRRRRVPSSS